MATVLPPLGEQEGPLLTKNLNKTKQNKTKDQGLGQGKGPPGCSGAPNIQHSMWVAPDNTYEPIIKCRRHLVSLSTQRPRAECATSSRTSLSLHYYPFLNPGKRRPREIKKLNLGHTARQ